jgi:putative sterol carrier protein
MYYEEIVQRVKDSLLSADVSDYKKHLAVQFNITGEGSGIFYVLLDNGTIDVQPYDYKDNDVIFTMSAQDLFDMIDGKLDSVKAYQEGKIDVSNIPSALEVKKVLDGVKAKTEAEAKAKAKAEKLAQQEKEKAVAKAKAEEEKIAKAKAKEEAKAEKATTKKTTATKKAKK